MKIKKIKIENVRGISKKEIIADIYPNKPIFFVAPNGFGKTSIATAFNSINRNKIDVSDENKYKNIIDLKSKVEINDEEDTYIADSDSNTISKHYSVFVINSQVKSKAATQNFGHFSSSRSSLVVEPIVLYNTIPKIKKLEYSINDMKRSFGCSAGKVLINLKKYISSPELVLKLQDKKNDFEKLLHKENESKLNDYLKNVNSINGTAKKILDNVLDLSEINSIESFNEILKEFNFLFSGKNIIEKVINVIQLKELYKNNKNEICNIFKYYRFVQDENEINEMLCFFNCTWKKIKTSKKGKKLLLEFPKANDISNGERDILCFIGKLFEAKNKLKKDKCILIIDEIFDYLDDANLIAAQYFVIKFIKYFKDSGKQLFPIILTHLDPMFFNTYSFSTKNVIYLEKIPQISNKYKINNMLKDRENCKKKQKEIYDIISSNYLHYSEEDKEIKEYLENIGVEDKIWTSKGFKEAANLELEAYKNGLEYDIALVCCGLRLAVEKMAFDQLLEEYKNVFLLTFKTTDKLSFAKENGAYIPEIHFLLSIIYNEAMHLDSQCQKLNPIGCKLRNKVIKHMISEI